MSRSNSPQENAQPSVSTSGNALRLASALHVALPIVLALEECDAKRRAEAISLFKQLNSGTLDASACATTFTLLAEMLFPGGDASAFAGLDLEGEARTRTLSPKTRKILARMDQEDITFGERLRVVMDKKGIRQDALAEKIGVGQPAISMMLQRTCRPQKRTVLRLAEALEVTPEELWPSMGQH